MLRGVQNLERLLSKYQARYGTDDDLVLRIRETLATQKLQDSSQARWRPPCPRTARRTGGRLMQGV